MDVYRRERAFVEDHSPPTQSEASRSSEDWYRSVNDDATFDFQRCNNIRSTLFPVVNERLD
jgi:hypothetical protein